MATSWIHVGATSASGARIARRVLTLLAAMVLLVATPLPASADHKSNPSTKNMRALGHSPHPASFADPPGEQEVSSDIAFWSHYAIHGNYDGFRIVDIRNPLKPRLLSHPRCNGDQGDVFVWENLVIRSWNSPAPEGRTCGGEPVEPGFEGLHIFDISDVSNPTLVGEVFLPCGSHTTTGVPDLENDRLVVYSNISHATETACPANPEYNSMDIVEVPLDDPAAAERIGEVPMVGGELELFGCHDAGAILGDVNLLACAAGEATNVFSIGEPGGGTLEEPELLYTVEEEELDEDGNLVGKVGIGGRWHSAAFTWDGEVLILGWEPGGGGAPFCTAENPDIDKSMFFYDARTGEKLGQWVLERPQTEDENCTIHNYNIVPTRSGRYVAVGGHYQAGTWAVDFTDPANARSIGWSDPEPMDPVGLGGAWSSYWYNGLIYESEIQTGLNVYLLVDLLALDAHRLPHLNPQTQDPDLLGRGHGR